MFHEAFIAWVAISVHFKPVISLTQNRNLGGPAKFGVINFSGEVSVEFCVINFNGHVSDHQ
jgi:hypothetical protein